jgi:hypothetical protein
MFFPLSESQVSHPYKTTGNIAHLGIMSIDFKIKFDKHGNNKIYGNIFFFYLD